MRVPKERYVSREWMAREWERLWTRVWLLACHAGELPAAGSFVTLELGRESILVVRESAERVRAYFNVCQHRGNILCAGEQGEATRFRCSYHHWEYGLDGAACATPGAEVGPIRLSELECEVRFGLVWMRLQPSAETIDEFLAPIRDTLSTWRPEHYRRTHENVIEIAANWKASVDVNNESYHLATLHPELRDHLDPAAIRVALRGPHSEMRIPLGRSDAARVALAAEVRRRAAADEIDLSALAPERLVEKHQVHVFPNVQLNFTALDLEIYRHRPHASEPGQMFFDEQLFQRGGRKPIRATRRRFKHGEHPVGPVIGADIDLLPALQRGMQSRGLEALELTEGEACIAHMHDQLERQLG